LLEKRFSGHGGAECLGSGGDTGNETGFGFSGFGFGFFVHVFRVRHLQFFQPAKCTHNFNKYAYLYPIIPFNPITPFIAHTHHYIYIEHNNPIFRFLFLIFFIYLLMKHEN